MSSGQLIKTWTLHKKKRINDYWNIDENRSLSDSWTGSSKKIYVVRWRDRQKFKRHHVQIFHGLTLGRELEKPRKVERNKNDPSDEDDKDTIKNARRYQWQLRCHAKRAFSRASIRETVGSKTEKSKASEAKTRFSCIAEAHDSTRQRIESVTTRIHEEHIAGKGDNSVLHCGLVHKFIPMKDLKKAIQLILQK